jgi:hypothetical protein
MHNLVIKLEVDIHGLAFNDLLYSAFASESLVSLRIVFDHFDQLSRGNQVVENHNILGKHGYLFLGIVHLGDCCFQGLVKRDYHAIGWFRTQKVRLIPVFVNLRPISFVILLRYLH